MSTKRETVAVLGAGSAGIAVARQVADSMDVTMFEPGLVGGECPHLACVPSKSLLHDAGGHREWSAAVDRRRHLTHDLEDDVHATELADLGAELVRSAGRVHGPGLVVSGSREYEVDHIVIATGGRPVSPDIDGVDEVADRVWTSRTAMTSDVVPDSMVIVGAGAVGVECATIYSSFGGLVTLIDGDPAPLSFTPLEVSNAVERNLVHAGVDFAGETALTALERTTDGLMAHLGDGGTIEASTVLLAAGRRPAVDDLGLETLGVSTEDDLPVGPDGRLRCSGSVWVVGDAMGRGEYTHVANHHADVVADHLVGARERTIGDVVTPACVFTSPPVIQVGPSRQELAGNPDVVWSTSRTDDLARTATDELGSGVLCVAADVTSGAPLAAAGVGPGFDELAAALVFAIDSGRSVAELARSMQPFPTTSEVIGTSLRQLHDHLRRL